jgi:hypothetical protein
MISYVSDLSVEPSNKMEKNSDALKSATLLSFTQQAM